MIYGSVCSGIEAASVAWGCLGWSPAWFAEVEKFPSAVLAHHWPQVNNLGDMTTIADKVMTGAVQAPDVLVGGTPCQAFSVAGLRGGLMDARGQLTVEFMRLADAIDSKREQPCIIVWENVPGVLSSKDNAFGCFLAGLAGETEPLQPAGVRWSNAGCVFGPQRAIAWRVLDAQYFGVAQRRRRVFVVASARDGFDPAAVLFESDGVRRDIAPSREAAKAVAALTANGVGTCGADDNQAQAGHLVPVAYRMAAFGEYADDETASTMKARDYKDATDLAVHGFQPRIARNGRGDMGEVCHALSAQAGQTGKGDSAPCVAQGVQVRRLTPTECERLQGFPDGHTDMPQPNGKQCHDGQRYKALGNSMAVPVMRWIGARVLMHIEGIL